MPESLLSWWWCLGGLRGLVLPADPPDPDMRSFTGAWSWSWPAVTRENLCRDNWDLSWDWGPITDDDDHEWWSLMMRVITRVSWWCALRWDCGEKLIAIVCQWQTGLSLWPHWVSVSWSPVCSRVREQSVSLCERPGTGDSGDQWRVSHLWCCTLQYTVHSTWNINKNSADHTHYTDHNNSESIK